MSEAEAQTGPEVSEVALATLPNLTAEARFHLERTFAGRREEIFSASMAQLTAIPGIGPVTAQAIHSVDLAAFQRRLQRWQALGVCILHPADADYPATLWKHFQAPPLLFTRGQWKPIQRHTVVGVVGTRTPSRVARNHTEELVERLVELGATLISGLALGIDTEAHWAAMRIPESYQIALLGSGVLQVYPQANQSLADALLLGAGTIVSQWAPDAAPARNQLVARNRTLAALCGALIVMETGEQGGAMYAARFAREFRRPVFVAKSEAAGNRRLLQENCRLLSHEVMEVMHAVGQMKDAESAMKPARKQRIRFGSVVPN
ncbi:MAG: DNA-processing protein DprA [Chloroflexi bacterium]|nr:DNA-processing protein DprA [Chloroflexota bacterium]